MAYRAGIPTSNAALANKDDTVYFDAASTGLRPRLIAQAIAAGKHIYTEKPIAPTLTEAVAIYRAPQKAQASSTASCRTSSGCRAC